jgi:hypothetical protein
LTSGWHEYLLCAVAIEGAESRVMIDPSLALTDDGIALFGDERMARGLAVSRSFYEALDDEARWSELEAFGVEVDGERIRRLRQALEPTWIEKFSYEDVETLTDDSRAIRDALLGDGEGLADAAADQWVFLVSRSWLLDKATRFLERVGRAAAQVWELTADEMRRVAEFLGSAARVIASGVKTAARVVEITIQAAGPAVAEALKTLGIHVDEAILRAIEAGAGLVVEYDP